MTAGPVSARTHRLFLGIPAACVATLLLPQLPPAIFEGQSAREILKPARHENWHLTLSFMPAVTPDLKDALITAMDNRDFGHAFVATLDRLSAFQSWDNASVLFAAPAKKDLQKLQMLADEARSLVRSVGIGQDDKPFAPHATLARFRRPCDLTSLVAPDDVRLLNPAPLPVGSLVLYESKRSAGEIYGHLTATELTSTGGRKT